MKRRLIPLLAMRNLWSDWFGTLCAIVGVALGTATVNVVVTLDLNTRSHESRRWSTDPTAPIDLSKTVHLEGFLASGESTKAEDAKEETHEDYQVMRSAIRLGSLSAFLVGALIVFFTFRVVIVERKREIALLRSLGASPKQVALIFLAESFIVGAIGAAAGFVAAPPMSIIAAMAGITTSGRGYLGWLWWPWKTMLAIACIGGATAPLGVLRPIREVLRMDVPSILRPQFLEQEGSQKRKVGSGFTLITLPFVVLLYILVRPFFVEVLPSLTFFIAEAALVCLGFVSLVVLVPDVVRRLGGGLARLVLARSVSAPRLLTARRVQRVGDELGWAVSGVMVVFALLLALHIATRSLKDEVVRWASQSVRDNAYVFTRRGEYPVPSRLVSRVPDHALRLRFSGRTPWPNPILAADTEELVRFADSVSPEDGVLARKLTKGKVILSGMMARRFGLAAGDFLRVQGRRRSARLEVVGVTDTIGYMPMIGPYRNSKTYGLISDADFDLIADYTGPIGAGVAFRDPTWTGPSPPPFWDEALEPARRPGLRVEVGSQFERDRVRETNRDFAIFDVILALTAVLAGVGITNHLVLAAHARRREIALYRVLGMEIRQIRHLFLLEGVFVGAMGGALAVALGIPLGFSVIQALSAISAFEVHFHLPWFYPVLTVLGAIVVALASAVYPASRAARFSSAESIHYE